MSRDEVNTVTTYKLKWQLQQSSTHPDTVLLPVLEFNIKSDDNMSKQFSVEVDIYFLFHQGVSLRTYYTVIKLSFLIMSAMSFFSYTNMFTRCSTLQSSLVSHRTVISPGIFVILYEFLWPLLFWWTVIALFTARKKRVNYLFVSKISNLLS